MATGIRQNQHLRNIVTAMRNVEANWIALSALERCQKISTAVVAALRVVYVPEPRLQVANLGGGLNGQFDFGPWVLQVNTSMAIGNVRQTVNQRKEVIARLGDVITHEARHCEQWWRMARLAVAWMRAKGLMPAANVLSGQLPGVSINILERAVGAPPLTPIEVAETEQWYESVYGGGSSFREINVMGRNLRPTGGRFAEVGQQFQQSEFARYQRGLAEEEDAHQAGREVQALFLQGSGMAPQQLIGHRPISQGIAHY